MRQANFISRLANISLLTVLLALAVASIAENTLIQQAASAADSSTAKNSLYRQALYEVALEVSVQYEYALRPSFLLQEEHLADANALIALLQYIQQDGNPVDRDFAGQVLAEQAAYLVASGQYFAAVDAHDLSQARTVHYQKIDPVFDRIQQQMQSRASAAQVQAAHDQVQSAQIQHITFLITSIMFALGLIFTLITGRITRQYRMKIDQNMQTEMQQLEYLALTDPLTGLGNHHAFQKRLSQALEETQRGEDVLVLAFLDIDEFKVFNDEQGYQHGDDVLCTIAAMLREANLSHDLFRLGSDDFALIVAQAVLQDTALSLERFREDIERHALGVTVSIGVAHTLSGGLDRETLHAHVSAALQEAKRSGRNRTLSFEAIEESVSLISSTKIQALRRLLSDGKVRIAFQPIWSLSTNSVIAFEALTRPPAEYGFSGPQEMFDIAEHIERAHELDAICVKAILARAADLPADTLLFMNLTPQTLVHDLLTGATLLEAITTAGLEPSRIVLEITERSIVQLEKIVQKVKYLRLMGFRVALDDVGAGNAGLEMLSQLAVDFVKIDRAIVSRALTDLAAYSVLVGIIAIAHGSHITVVAEGIENPEMLDLVQQIQVQCVQGYLFGRPSETIPHASTLQNLSPFQYIGLQKATASTKQEEAEGPTTSDEPQVNPLYDIYT